MRTRHGLFPFVLLLVALLGGRAFADEGMWPLYDLDKLPFDDLHARGLELEPEDIYDPGGGGIARAVFDIGGGTGSFVSPNGLIITNHHVAFGAVQQKSSLENNYIRDGFYAATRDQEIPAIGYTLYVALSSEDVTDRVLAGVDDEMDALERYRAIEMARKRIIKEAEEGRDVKCRIASMFGGTQYILYTNFEIRDIRIVYAPPASIGNYGGDIDNWMWPRHTGDYSFLRAYVAPDGSSAEYSEENVPYRPAVWLPVSSAGLSEGEFTLVIGFPGGTSRYISSFSVENLIHNEYPRIIGLLEDVLDIYERASAADSAVAIRLASNMEGYNNVLKNSYGMTEGFERFGLLQYKQQSERQLQAFVERDRKLKKAYGNVLPELKKVYDEMIRTREKDFMLGILNLASDFYGMSARIYKWSVEREKEDIDREPGYQDRDSTRTRERLEQAQINLLPEVDRQTFRYILTRALDLPGDQKIEAIEKIFAGRMGEARERFMDEYLDALYGNTRVGTVEGRLAMLRMSRRELEALGDPFIDLAASLKPEVDEQIDRAKRFRGGRSKLEPKLIAAYAAWKPGQIYPDANGTMRLNWGSVAGYSPRDAVHYDYLTCLRGVMEKETGENPFVVPGPLKEAWARKDYGPYVDSACGDVPVCFLTTNDSTGGNSGSPVLNGRGELAGVLFDGNYEAIAADYLYDAGLARSIMVDVRYVLFTIDKVYGLRELVDELTIH